MESLWSDDDARRAIAKWAGIGKDVALRIYSARLIAGDPSLVLHGGGNVSVKCTVRTPFGEEVPGIRIKASGTDLRQIEPEGLPALRLDGLRRWRSVSALDGSAPGDDKLVDLLRRELVDSSAPTPSIESLVHAFLPHRFVDHSHADAVLMLTNRPNGAGRVREAIGNEYAILPYVRPGFDLACAVAEAHEASPHAKGIVLMKHGLITFGDDARTSYERHVHCAAACDAFLKRRATRHTIVGSDSDMQHAKERASRVAPMLRGLLAGRTNDEDHPFARSIVHWRCHKELAAVIDHADAAGMALSGPLTGDHVIRTGAWYLYVGKPRCGDDAVLREQLSMAVSDFQHRYERHCSAAPAAHDVDSLPRVVLLPGVGMFTRGRTHRDALIAADIAERTLVAKLRAATLGPYEGLGGDHLLDAEFRRCQKNKIDRGPEQPLTGQVALITGGAGAIGSAVARECARAGAHVVIADIDDDAANRAARRIEQESAPEATMALPMDVTDEKSVAGGFATVARRWGGVDVVVPNAGVAHAATIAQLATADFKRIMEINALGTMLVIREAARMMGRQGTGGNVVIISSKNVFAPGREFGAYSASKAAGHQLGRVAALELAPLGIRVNLINADAVFGDEETPSGLWSAVGPGRARAHGVEASRLADYYRDRNLLKARIHGRHVGRAVVFFASNATPTTGATFPIDGGLPEAFPR